MALDGFIILCLFFPNNFYLQKFTFFKLTIVSLGFGCSRIVARYLFDRNYVNGRSLEMVIEG